MNHEDYNLCLQCGFCCDGTLFVNAGIKEYEAIASEYDFEIIGDVKRAFLLPCPYYQSHGCPIYDNRPYIVCAEFKCELLQRQLSGEISYSDALARIHELNALKSKLEIQIMACHPENPGKSTIQKIFVFEKHFQSVMTEAEFKKTFGFLLLDIFIFRRKSSLLFKENKK